MAIDFLIVGGGIGGAVLANLLGRSKRVVVLEKGRSPLPQNRPEILWPPTVRVLRGLIPAEKEGRWALPLRGGQFALGGRVLLRLGPEVVASPDTQPCSTANTRQLLLEQAPCEVRRGVEVVRVLSQAGRVVGVRTRDAATGAEEDVLAEWTVGDDGVHSAIRRGCGARMSLVSFPLTLLGFSYDWPASLPPDEARLFVNERRLRTGLLLMGCAPLPEGRGVALVAAWSEALRDERRFRQALADLAGQESLMRDLLERPYPEAFTTFHLSWGRKPTFGAPGALLMGDAAHPVTPAGGQGANLSVADALVIADAALHRPGDLLEEYRRRRRPAAERSLAFSRTATRVFSLPRPALDLGLLAAPWAARWFGRLAFSRLVRTAARAFRETGGE
jgi:2-polyprenyl-6-methoxyphenol hydroxylase-like FAD-dependent oxidoreductase